MAGDWIKWVKGLVRRREVIAVASKLSMDCRIVASSCMLLWEWADDNTTDGHVGDIGRGDIDAIAGLHGFADALVSVGWLRVTAKGITIVNFESHNGESAKARALNNKRKQASRVRHDSVTKMSRSHRDKNVTREEKRREEKQQQNTPPPRPGDRADTPPPGSAAAAAAIAQCLKAEGIGSPELENLARSGISLSFAQAAIRDWRATGKGVGVLVLNLRAEAEKCRGIELQNRQLQEFKARNPAERHAACDRFRKAMGPTWSHISDDRVVLTSKFRAFLADESAQTNQPMPLKLNREGAA